MVSIKLARKLITGLVRAGLTEEQVAAIAGDPALLAEFRKIHCGEAGTFDYPDIDMDPDPDVPQQYELIPHEKSGKLKKPKPKLKKKQR